MTATCFLAASSPRAADQHANFGHHAVDYKAFGSEGFDDPGKRNAWRIHPRSVFLAESAARLRTRMRPSRLGMTTRFSSRVAEALCWPWVPAMQWGGHDLELGVVFSVRVHGGEDRYALRGGVTVEPFDGRNHALCSRDIERARRDRENRAAYRHRGMTVFMVWTAEPNTGRDAWPRGRGIPAWVRLYPSRDSGKRAVLADLLLHTVSSAGSGRSARAVRDCRSPAMAR